MAKRLPPTDDELRQLNSAPLVDGGGVIRLVKDIIERAYEDALAGDRGAINFFSPDNRALIHWCDHLGWDAGRLAAQVRITCAELGVFSVHNQPVPIEAWGVDHWSLLLRVDEWRGQIDQSAIRPRRPDSPTLIRDGGAIPRHGDNDCLTDMVAIGVLLRLDDWKFALTELGERLVIKARRFATEWRRATPGRNINWDEFDPFE